MIRKGQVIKVEQAEFVAGYMLRLIFNDGLAQEVDFSDFLSRSSNPLIREYLDKDKFMQFEINDGDLEWNDYDLCFPVADLHENNIN